MGILQRIAIHAASILMALSFGAALAAEPEWPRFHCILATCFEPSTSRNKKGEPSDHSHH